jgi:hypothetical protein
VNEISKLSKQIREALASGSGHAPVESLAAQYARLCREAEQRLESCAAMLEKGSEYQALQLAEAEPVLLDMIAALSFAEAQEWSSFCAANQLQVPVKFDSKALDALDRLYSKGISPNHPLYKDYRSAVTSRDDAKAIQIIRSIVRVNPSDANAKSELARLENKLFQLKLQELRASLGDGETESIVVHLAELERLAGPERLAELSEYAKACSIRRAEERKEALLTAQRLCRLLAEEHQAGAWRMVGDLVARIRDLQNEHGFTLTKEEEAQCAEMQSYFTLHRTEAEQTALLNQAIGAVGVLADRIDSRVLARSTMDLGEAESLCVELNRLWNALEAFKRPVPDALLLRVRSSSSSLRTELDRMQRQRRLKIVSGSATLASLVAISALFIVSANRASDFAIQLAQLRGAGQLATAEKMLVEVPEQHPYLSSQAKLKARLDEISHWAKTERDKVQDFDSRLNKLEGSIGEDASSLAPADLALELDSVTQLLEKIANDQRSLYAGRLLVLRNKFEARLSLMREQLLRKADAELVALAGLSGEKLLYEKSKADLTDALREVEPRLKRLELDLSSQIPGLQIPTAYATRVSELRRRVDLFKAELQKLADVRESIAKAVALDPYLEALRGFRDSLLAQDQEVIGARMLLETFPKIESLLAEMLMPGDPEGWAVARSDTARGAMIPQGVSQREKERLLAIRKDQFITDVWEVDYIDFKRKNKKVTLYLQGNELTETKSNKGAFENTTWKGLLYYPGPTTESPSFMVQEINMKKSELGAVGDGEVKSRKLSASSNCLRLLELNRMTDAEATRFERSPLQILEQLVRNKEPNVLCKAYLYQQLAELIRERPYWWGWQYSASLRADVAELDQICGRASLRSYDWLVEVRNSQLGPKLTSFFNKVENRRYYSEALLHREILQGVMSAGLKYGGFIDGEGTPRLLGEAQNREELWTLADNGRYLMRYSPPGAKSNAAKSKPFRFSPVFFVPLDRRGFSEQLLRKYTGSGHPLTLPSIPWCKET